MKKPIALFLALAALWLGACKNEPKERFLPPSTGGVNSLMVVLDTELWQGPVGDKIREEFAAQVLGLPQAEPLFSITQVPPQVFKTTTTYSRSVLYVEQEESSLAHINKDVYAKPQNVAVATGATEEALIANLDALAPKAIAAFKATEIAEAQRRMGRSLSKDAALEEVFGLRLDVPSLYKVGKRDDNFVW